MASISVRDVIDRAKGLHQQLAQVYQRLGDREPRERIKMLLDYMSRHERHLEAALLRFEQDARASILNHWFKSDAGVLDLLRDPPRITPAMEPAQVVEMALHYDDALIALYERMATGSAPPAVREFFTDLLQHERKEERRLARDTVEMEEM